MSHNNSYGNYAGQFLEECLPNINGQVGNVVRKDNINTGAFYYDNPSSYGIGNKGSYFTTYPVKFSLAKDNSIYKQECNAVRVSSYGVYIWIRTN